MDFDKEVDARGLNCPLPILRAKKALAEMQAGQVLHVLATDPGSVKDFAAFARQTGNELVAHNELADNVLGAVRRERRRSSTVGPRSSFAMKRTPRACARWR